MIEDELLKLGLNRGRPEALRRIYEKYPNYMLSVAMACSSSRAPATASATGPT